MYQRLQDPGLCEGSVFQPILSLVGRKEEVLQSRDPVEGGRTLPDSSKRKIKMVEKEIQAPSSQIIYHLLTKGNIMMGMCL